MSKLEQHQLKETKWFEKEKWGAFWEKGYSDLNVSCMGGPSFEVVEIVPALPKNAKVLDLACGEGRNSLYLATKGFDVTAIDRSVAGINKLLHFAQKANVKVTGIVSDIVNLDILEDYDLVMAHGCLYYLSNEEWRALLSDVKDHTKPGGFNIYSVFIFNSKYPKPHEFKSARYMASFAPNELKEFYEGWEQYRYDVYDKWDSHPGIPIHCHPVEKLVARKPGGAKLNIQVEEVPTKLNMTEEQLLSIQMGIPAGDVVKKFGIPDQKDKITAEGLQFGAVTVAREGKPVATVQNYDLELWYYGKKCVVYIMNGEAWGLAYHTSPPVRVRVNP